MRTRSTSDIIPWLPAAALLLTLAMLPAGVATAQPVGSPTAKTRQAQRDTTVTRPASRVTPGPLPGGGYVSSAAPAPPKIVKFVQRRVSRSGFPARVDGVFGPQTERAVRRFQSAGRLLVDGVVGRQTMSALRAPARGRPGAVTGPEGRLETQTAQTPAVQAHLLWGRYDRAAISRQLDMAKEMGAGMVRVDLGWASLEEGGKGSYNSWYLGKVDHVVSEAEARGIKVLFTFWETPCWASSAPETIKQGCAGRWWERGVQRYAPTSAADFADALAFLVKRYGKRVAAWELWNEPNHADFFKAADKVSSYAALVKAAYPAAKAADPSATIIGGSLADADFEFTEALYAKGVKGNFDAWSVHPYSEDRSPLHPGIPGWEEKSFITGVPRVRDTMLRHGDDKPLWLTEFGWSTCNVRGQREAYRNCVDPEIQASYLQLAYRQMQSFDYVPVGVWFNLEDTSADLSDRVDNYGLFTHDGKRKAAVSAFQASSQAVTGAQPVPEPATLPGAGAGTAPTPGSSPPVGMPEPSGMPSYTGTPVSVRAKPSAGAPSSKPTDATSTKKGGGRVALKVVRRGGRVNLAGTLPVGRTLYVRAYGSRAGRFGGKPAYRRRIKVSSSGRFRHRIPSRALTRGKLKVVVTNRGRPALVASKVVR